MTNEREELRRFEAGVPGVVEELRPLYSRQALGLYFSRRGCESDWLRFAESMDASSGAAALRALIAISEWTFPALLLVDAKVTASLYALLAEKMEQAG